MHGSKPGVREASGATPSMAVIEAVAAETGRDPIDLPPLYGTVDGDALDSLFAGPGPEGTDVRVRLEYDGVTVEVREGGDAVVLDPDPPGADGDT